MTDILTVDNLKLVLCFSISYCVIIEYGSYLLSLVIRCPDVVLDVRAFVVISGMNSCSSMEEAYATSPDAFVVWWGLKRYLLIVQTARHWTKLFLCTLFQIVGGWCYNQERLK